MAGIRVQGDLSSNVAEVNAQKELTVALTKTEDNAGFVNLSVKMGDGEYVGTPYVERLVASDAGRLTVGLDQPLLAEPFVGAALNTTIWSTLLTTMTASVSGGFLTLNAGLSVAVNTAASVRSWRHFPIYKGFPTAFLADLQFSQPPITNNICEWGLFIASGITAVTDGVLFRVNAAGELRCVVVNNSVEIQSPALSAAALLGGANVTRRFKITVGDAEVDFYINDIHVAGIELGNASATVTASMNLPIAFRNYNVGALSVAQVMKISSTAAVAGDMNTGRTWPAIMAGMGGNAAQGQSGGTLGTTAALTNNQVLGGAGITNSGVALPSGLGGLLTVLPTLVANSDGILSSYQVPIGSAAVPGRSLIIQAIRIHGVVTTVLAGGPVIAFLYLAFGHTAAALTTAEGATTKAPRRLPLGIQVYPLNAAVGVRDDREIQMELPTPIVVQPGEFIQTVLKNIGTITTTGAITFSIAFVGHWE